MDITSIDKSRAFYRGVSATALKWNRAGKVKAMGVQVTAPRIDRNLSSLSFSSTVTTTVAPTRTILLQFLLHCLFRDFGQLAYR